VSSCPRTPADPNGLRAPFPGDDEGDNSLLTPRDPTAPRVHFPEGEDGGPNLNLKTKLRKPGTAVPSPLTPVGEPSVCRTCPLHRLTSRHLRPPSGAAGGFPTCLCHRATFRRPQLLPASSSGSKRSSRGRRQPPQPTTPSPPASSGSRGTKKSDPYAGLRPTPPPSKRLYPEVPPEEEDKKKPKKRTKPPGFTDSSDDAASAKSKRSRGGGAAVTVPVTPPASSSSGAEGSEKSHTALEIQSSSGSGKSSRAKSTSSSSSGKKGKVAIDVESSSGRGPRSSSSGDSEYGALRNPGFRPGADNFEAWYETTKKEDEERGRGPWTRLTSSSGHENWRQRAGTPRFFTGKSSTN
jgi:hypothetical protein